MPNRLPPDPITRRGLLGLAASSTIGVVVSQYALGCSSADALVVDSAGIGGNAACVLTAALTEGPFFVDERLNRSDIRSDPASGAVSDGVPLEILFNVSRVAANACTPLTGAYLDVWHCDAAGVYSDVGGAGAGRRFLRGYQLTDGSGQARFTTLYPGWYSGRAVHIHFKLRLIAGATTTYEFTSQFFFDESLTDTVHMRSPYASRGTRNVRNASDGIFNSLSSSEKAALTLQTSPTASGYGGVINLGVRLA
jgi:protocatechuate 3,4-dioxygenase beta subunit